MADTSDRQATKVITLGCRLNAYESDVIAQNARDVEDHGAVVINTCAVTNDAVAESRRQVRKAKRDNPDARIIVTGCAAQINPAMFANMSEVDQVLGNHEKMNPMSFGPDAPTERIRVNDIMSVRETAPQFMGSENSPNLKSQSRSRAFLQVQNGCDHRCTFCIIPYGHGMPISDIMLSEFSNMTSVSVGKPAIISAPNVKSGRADFRRWHKSTASARLWRRFIRFKIISSPACKERCR